MEENNLEQDRFDKLKKKISSNKRLVVLIGILIFLTAFAITLNFIVFGSVNDSPPEEVDADKENLVEEDDEADEEIDMDKAVELLPSNDNDLDEKEDYKDRDGASLDPFSGPMELKGVVIEGGGDNYAIILADGRRRIAKEGDIIFGGWEVLEVSRNTVVLQSGDRDTELELD
ncbi:hypothetical protein [Natranaerofaba carboxydovora]|uniref:hypothetical protein n=1 Tax=Natranaerofaba carboxydovora TaxID=2742683 RepID=UPI001F12A9D9|nr:hypothetical protein [Natranaerofaba carboxydovora]UMZ73510.1 hypothetical protein ACONDI_01064 [Natranaerofaba carboxydovora]